MELQQPITPDAPLYKILTESTLIKRHLTEAQKKDLQPYAAISGLHYLKMLIAECPEVLSSIHTLTPSATVWYDLDLVPLYTGTTFVGLPATQLDQHTLQVPAVQHVIDRDYLGHPQDIGFLNFIQQTSRDACQFHLDTAARLAQEPSSKCKQLAIEHLHAAWALNPEEVQTTRDDILSYLKDNVLMLQGIAIASALELKSDNIQAGSPIILDDANAPHHLNWLTLIPSYKHYIKTRERAPGSRTMPGIHLNRYQNLAQYDKPRLSETEEKTLREILILEQQAFQHMRDTTNLEAARKIIDQLELKLQSINLPTDDVAYLRALYWNLKGDATQSLAHVETFLARHPENLEALTLFATIQLESNKLEEVKNKTLPRIRAVTGTDKNYHYLIIKAQFEERRNNLQEARTCFLQAIEARPNEPHTKVKETVLILDMRLGDKTAAKHHASNFLKQNISFTFAHYILGSMALEEGNLEDARIYLEHASIKSNTPTALAYNDLAELHRRQKDYRHAYEYAKTAYQQLPGLIIAHETAAAALIELGDYVRAEAELNTAIAKTKNAPLDARIRLTRAILLSKTNRLEEARQELKKIHPTTLDKTSQKEYERLLQTL
jgi:tetratricopeptide (TPR) repeat protein